MQALVLHSVHPRAHQILCQQRAVQRGQAGVRACRQQTEGGRSAEGNGKAVWGEGRYQQGNEGPHRREGQK